jgi:hypothetical protein
VAAFVGWSKFLHFAAENDWGTLNGTTLAYAFMPVNEYGVRMRPQSRQSDAYTGLRQGKQSKIYRGLPSGNLVAPLFGYRASGFGDSLMELMLEWGFGNHESVDLASKTVEWSEGPDIANKRHLGMRVNSATLAGSADADEVTITLDLMGKSEVGNSGFTNQAIPDDMEKLVYVQFNDCSFTIGGVAIELESFSLEVQNNLQAKYLNAFAPSYLLPGNRVLNLSITPVKLDDVYDAYNRTEGSTELAHTIVLKGLHNGTGGSAGTNYTVATISLPRGSFIEADTQGGKGDIAMQPLQFRCLKPDTSANDMLVTYSEAA